MAISRVKVWSSGEVLTASDLNAEINNVLNNGADLVSPFTKAISMGGFALNFDAANTMAITSSAKGLNLSSTTAINDVFTTVASAATPDIWTAVGGVVNYTGTVTATGFSAAPQAGASRRLVCAGAAVFTAGANVFIAGVSSGSNYTAAADDVILVMALTTTQFLLVPLKYDGTPIALGANTVTAAKLATSSMGFSLINGTLTAAVGTNILTVSIKTLAGNDPSATDPVYVLFRNATAATGDYTTLTLSAATSIATTVGGTFGVANTVPCRLWVVGFNDGGTFRLALINCVTTAAGVGSGRIVSAVFGLSGWGIASATQIGAGSTSAATFYSNGAAVTSKSYAVLGYLAYESGVTTMGTFTAAPTRLQLFSRNDPLPGQMVQIARTDTGSVATGTNTVPLDDTIPQNTEGDQYLSQAITPSSAANVLEVIALFMGARSTGANNGVVSLYQDAVANALASSFYTQTTADSQVQANINYPMLAATTSATTFKIRAGADAAGTTTFNGRSAGRLYGGVANSFLKIAEVMA